MRRVVFVFIMLFLVQPLAAEVPPSPLQADRVVIEKFRHLMTLYRGGKPLRRYVVALGSGGLGPKRRQNDKRTPEGLYRIDGRTPRSGYHLALHISYPNAGDIAAAKARGDARRRHHDPWDPQRIRLVGSATQGDGLDGRVYRHHRRGNRGNLEACAGRHPGGDQAVSGFLRIGLLDV
jgi:hypothetical protein